MTNIHEALGAAKPTAQPKLDAEQVGSNGLILVYDTETDGFTKPKLAKTDPSQPHVVQIACSLIEQDGTERACFHAIVKPDGYSIPAETAAIHGIDTALAERVGVPAQVAMAAFCQLRARASEVAAHNEEFDWFVLEVALARLGIRPTKTWPKRTCTMRGSTALVNLPPTPKMIKAGFTKNKPPSLMELHTFLFGEGFEGAHDAMVDVRACSRSLVELRRRGVL